MASLPYFDCNATTPIEPAVMEKIRFHMEIEFGNAGSRTHDYGQRANRAVKIARTQIAELVLSSPEEVIFTSGATESNNLALLGLEAYGVASGKMHIVSTCIEHKAVLEPLSYLAGKGWQISLVAPRQSGVVTARDILDLVRNDTLLVSVMHVNNETGVIQPIEEIADGLKSLPAFFHVDAAQGFGKIIKPLQNSRIDLISVSAHKIFGPKGVGALITRRRIYKKPPLLPIMHGGGQERGLRPGTLPVPLIAGFGEAAALAQKNHIERAKKCLSIKAKAIELVKTLGGLINGDQACCVPNTLNFSIPGINSESVLIALKNIMAISNGAACTSSAYTLSHVLTAMGLPREQIEGALRFSWCHLTEEPDWNVAVSHLKKTL